MRVEHQLRQRPQAFIFLNLSRVQFYSFVELVFADLYLPPSSPKPATRRLVVSTGGICLLGKEPTSSGLGVVNGAKCGDKVCFVVKCKL